jgi:hypothetical protein
VTNDEMNLYLAQQADKTVQLDIARGNVGAAVTDSAKVGAYASHISDGAMRAQADAIYADEQTKIAALQSNPDDTASLQEAAATADRNVVSGVADRNADADYLAAGQSEVNDIRTAEKAQELGLNPGTAYEFGLGVAKAEKTIKDNLPADLSTSLKTFGAIAVAILFLFLLLKVV